jgi:hypothetical protein
LLVFGLSPRQVRGRRTVTPPRALPNRGGALSSKAQVGFASPGFADHLAEPRQDLRVVDL